MRGKIRRNYLLLGRDVAKGSTLSVTPAYATATVTFNGQYELIINGERSNTELISISYDHTGWEGRGIWRSSITIGTLRENQYFLLNK